MRNKQTNQKHVDTVVSVFISHFGCEEAQNEIPPASKFSMTYRQGCTEGWKEVTIPQGRKSPNNVTSTFFFNTTHLLPNDLSSNMGAPNLLLAPDPIWTRYARTCRTPATTANPGANKAAWQFCCQMFRLHTLRSYLVQTAFDTN